MGLMSILSGKWFTRLILIIWMVCGISIFVVFKNMELIVHGQLYYYGLVFSADWADPYRIFTWLLFVCISVPMAFSGVALVSSFINVEKVPQRSNLVPQKAAPPRAIVKSVHTTRPQVQQTVKPPSTPSRSDNGSGNGISCPECKKVFGRALVMLDFRSGSNRMVSVCPYCNCVLGYTSQEKTQNENFVAESDKTILR
jgi:hypothetical protein